MPYDSINLNLSKAQQKKLINGQPIRVLKTQIDNGGSPVYLHPMNYKKLMNCKKACNMSMSEGEIMYTMKNNGLIGAGILDSIWSGVKKVGSFLKDTGLATPLADLAQSVAEPIIGKTASTVARDAFRGVTGVGLTKQQKIENMNRARSMKKGKINIMPSGSFRIN